MHSQFKDQVFRQAGMSYLVLDRCPEAPDFLLVKAISPGREVKRVHQDEVAVSLKRAAGASPAAVGGLA